MIKQFLYLGLAAGLTLATTKARAQATLSTSPYTENFDGLANGLPTGFSVYTLPTATSLGTPPTSAQLILTPGTATLWTATGVGFKNVASATGLDNTASAAVQTAATNRALAIRQTGSFGDAIAAPAGAAFVFQAANTTGKTDFALSFKLQSLDSSSPRVTTWQVDYGIGANPTTFTPVGTSATTGGSTFSNNTVTVNFSTALDNQSGPVYIRIAALNPTTGSSNRPTTAIDDFSLTWNSPTASTPVLTATPTALAFGNQNINSPSAAQTYALSGTNLTSATTVTATGPFTVSKDNTTFATSLSYDAADLAAAKTVYVRFTPTATGAATGSITNAATGAVSRTIALTGYGLDPNQTSFNFSTCATSLSDGWSQYSVTGAQTWACTTFGRDPAAPTGTAAAPYGVQVNGYAGGNVENEDWFISPAFNLSTYTYPLLSFWSRTAFNGPALKLRVSTNYSGTGAPSAATWTDVNATFPANGSDTWTQTTNVNLAAYKGAKVYVAFVYTSTTTAAARWTLDDIAIANSTTPPAPSLLVSASRVAFGYTAAGTNADRTITVAGSDLTGDVTLTTSGTPFTLSKDGAAPFTTSLILTRAELSASKAVTVRFSPSVAFTTYSGTMSVSTPGAAAALSVALSGDTYDPAKTLEVVNWNIEWFGSAVSANLGPANKDLQQTNVTSVLNTLRADVYALQEVVDTLRLYNVVNQLSAATGIPYAYKVSYFGSYADNVQDVDYPSAQKLAFIYNTNVVKNPTFTALLRCSQADACAAFTPWASGRFPYMMTANVTLDGTTKQIRFIAIHAKSGSADADYNRRKAGADLLKTELDTKYGSDNILLAGDYNDVLNGTIATGITPAVSSYSSFVNDAANYSSPTLPLAQAGAQSTVSYNTVIDNVIVSNELASSYLAGSAAVRTDVASGIANYASTTTDHYPVYTRYRFSNALAITASRTAALGLYPNPVTNAVRFEVPETGTNLGLQVFTVEGRLVLNGTGSVEQLNQQLSQRVASLSNGMYLMRVVGAQQTYTNRFQKL
jgi:endonuclease/exonuclease/phosphatase family metal-dependent hydrolase